MTIKEYLEKLEPQQLITVYLNKNTLLASNTVEILSKSINPKWFSLKIVNETILKNMIILIVEE